MTSFEEMDESTKDQDRNQDSNKDQNQDLNQHPHVFNRMFQHSSEDREEECKLAITYVPHWSQMWPMWPDFPSCQRSNVCTHPWGDRVKVICGRWRPTASNPLHSLLVLLQLGCSRINECHFSRFTQVLLLITYSHSDLTKVSLKTTFT